MQKELTSEQWRSLEANGHLRLEGVFTPEEFAEISAATKALVDEFPFGFLHIGNDYDPSNPVPRSSPAKPDDITPTNIVPHIGFRNPIFHKIIEKDVIYNTVARVLGPDFVLSNTWLEVVPPGLMTRLGYHKDRRGTFSFTVLLEEQEWNTGSTCLVPGSHRSTPPPTYCMADTGSEHPREIHLSGKSGDICFFSTEAWHGRAANTSDRPMCRLFFGCYGRRSHDNATWSRAINSQQLATAVAQLAPEHRHLLRIDDGTNKSQRQKWSRFRRWYTADGWCSMRYVNDLCFGLFAPKRPRAGDPAGQMPYVTNIAGRFSLLHYLACSSPRLVLKSAVGFVLDRHPLGVKIKNHIKAAMGRRENRVSA